MSGDNKAIVICIGWVALMVIVGLSWWGANYRLGIWAETEAMKAGYCQVLTPGTMSFHWEECK
jgi:type IV secretory pathway TrbD component